MLFLFTFGNRLLWEPSAAILETTLTSDHREKHARFLLVGAGEEAATRMRRAGPQVTGCCSAPGERVHPASRQDCRGWLPFTTLAHGSAVPWLEVGLGVTASQRGLCMSRLHPCHPHTPAPSTAADVGTPPPPAAHS